MFTATTFYRFVVSLQGELDNIWSELPDGSWAIVASRDPAVISEGEPGAWIGGMEYEEHFGHDYWKCGEYYYDVKSIDDSVRHWLETKFYTLNDSKAMWAMFDLLQQGWYFRSTWGLKLCWDMERCCKKFGNVQEIFDTHVQDGMFWHADEMELDDASNCPDEETQVGFDVQWELVVPERFINDRYDWDITGLVRAWSPQNVIDLTGDDDISVIDLTFDDDVTVIDLTLEED